MNDTAPGVPVGRSRLASFTWGYGLGVALIGVFFAVPLYKLASYALGSELYSHILLVPFVTGYLIWLRRWRLASTMSTDPLAAVVPAVAAIFLLGFHAIRSASGSVAEEDSLFALTGAFLLLLIAVTALCFGRGLLKSLAFPILFLAFMLPLPTALAAEVEGALQLGSAWVAGVMFQLAGTPVFHDESILLIPGMNLQVTRECSGIHSTLVLLMTSLVAGNVFLAARWRRTALALAVIPIALLRNGLRIFIIGELCVRSGPEMIDSYLHRQGGPIFFAVSLLPLAFLLLALRRGDTGR